MKIRIGFVSNSSSSSFVFALPSKPGSAEELKNFLFGPRRKIYENIYKFDENDPVGWPVEDVAKIVFDTINQPEAQESENIERAFSGFIEEIDVTDFDEFELPSKERRIFWEKQRRARDEKVKKLKAEFLINNSGKEIYVMEIHDDSAIGSAMEHGSLFDNVPHIRISHH